MKIVVDNSGEYKDVMGDYYNLAKYNDDSITDVFFQGYNTTRNYQLKSAFSSYKTRRYLNLESPCSLLSTDTSIQDQSYFSHVYTICPYTAKWMGKFLPNTKFEVIPFPVSLDTLNKIPKGYKNYDAIYMGTLINSDHYNIVSTIKKHNCVFTSLNEYPPPYSTTHTNVTSSAKWELLGKSKISVGINQATLGSHNLSSIYSYKDWNLNKCFSDLNSLVVPQMKVRVTEAMAMKTINLIKKDQWNVIETWFKPDEHFIYWDDFYDLENKIEEIKNNFKKYENLIENAYKEVKKYDIDFLFKQWIKDAL